MTDQKGMLVVLQGEQNKYLEIDKVIATARQLDHRIILLIVAYNASLDSRYWFDKEGKHQAQQSYCQSLLQKLIDHVEAKQLTDIAIQCDIVWGKHVHEAVAEYCVSHPIDWVVKACGQYSLMERVFFTHSDWHLIREIDKPLWLIKDLSLYQDPLLVVAVDPAQSHDKPQTLDIELIQSGKALAERFDGRFQVMHAYDPIPPTLLTDIGSSAAQEITEQVAQQHRQAFNTLMKQQGVQESEQYLVEDDVHHALPAWLKQQQASLLLIGAVKRSKFNQWLLGSTAERLLESVETDILVLKPTTTV